MKKMVVILFFVASSLTAGAAVESNSEQAIPSVALPEEFAQILRYYEKFWSEKDLGALARLFTEDGCVLSSGAHPVCGRKAIEAFYHGHGGTLELRAIAYAKGETIGYIIGGYTWIPGGQDKGKFTITLRKNKSGRWKIVSDMDNSNTPAPKNE